MTAKDEAEIRAMMTEHARAIHDKNARAALAPNADDIVVFSLAPPLGRSGAAVSDPKGLEAWFATWRSPIETSVRDLHLEIDGDIGYAYGLSHMTGTKNDGHDIDLWYRLTLCFRRTGGAWKVVHTHESTPFYMDGSNRAALDLRP